MNTPARPSSEADCAVLSEFARRIRVKALHMVKRARSSHIGSALSIAELLATLYGRVLRVSPGSVDSPDRDRFILSKGHGCTALYAALSARGFFPEEWLDTFGLNGTKLPGHATTGIPGIEVSTGSLGHGLSLACGMALAGHRDRRDYRVFCLLSDGECDEGSTWEGVQFAPHHRLDNLVAIIDYNKIQSLGHTKDILDLEPFAAKWEAFRWSVREIDGHDIAEILATQQAVPFEAGKPSCVIAHTVKGKGVSFMEDKVLWHYRCPDDDEMRQALEELGEAES